MQHGLLPIFRVTLGGNHHCGLGSGLLVHPPLPVLLPGSYSRSFGPLAVWPQQEATGFCKAANGGDRGLEEWLQTKESRAKGLASCLLLSLV